MKATARAMTRAIVSIACAAAAVHIAGCGSGNVGVQPAIGVVDPAANDKLQFAVGVATINEQTQNKVVTVLNTVETFRQPSGLSAVLVDTPYITGPPGFVGQSDPLFGTPTSILSGSGPGIPCNKTEFGCTGGAFGYGFAPDNAIPTQQAPSFLAYSQPIPVGNQDLLQSAYYYGGPPAFPPFNDGTYPSGFLGYSPGFMTYQTSPVLGTYKLDVVVPTGAVATETISTSAVLSSTTGLPAMQAPTAFPDPANPGGLKIDIVVPAGVAEAWVFVHDSGGCYPQSQGNALNSQFYTVRTSQTGAQQLTLPPALGPTNGSGSTPTICSAAQNRQATGNPNAAGDTYTVYAAGFDYPAYADAYPFSTSPTPSLAGPGGQTDVTLTQPVNFVYP